MHTYIKSVKPPQHKSTKCTFISQAPLCLSHSLWHYNKHKECNNKKTTKFAKIIHEQPSHFTVPPKPNYKLNPKTQINH